MRMFNSPSRMASAKAATPVVDTAEREARENAERGSTALAMAIWRYVEKYHSGQRR